MNVYINVPKKKSLAPEQRVLEYKRNPIYCKKDHTSLSSLVPATQFYSCPCMPDLEIDAKKF